MIRYIDFRQSTLLKNSTLLLIDRAKGPGLSLSFRYTKKNNKVQIKKFRIYKT